MVETNEPSFKLGLHAGLVGRWTRLLVDAAVPLYAIVRERIAASLSVSFYTEMAIYFTVIFGLYLAAHYFLGERLLARTQPWIGTLILVGPPVLVLLFGLGPSSFQLALALYISMSLIFNFIMSYGGCEVMAIPSFIFGRRYTVYGPYNVVDLVAKVIADRKASTDGG